MGANGFELAGSAGGIPERDGVVRHEGAANSAAAAGGGLIDADAETGAGQGSGHTRGDEGFADGGVGANHEEAAAGV